MKPTLHLPSLLLLLLPLLPPTLAANPLLLPQTNTSALDAPPLLFNPNLLAHDPTQPIPVRDIIDGDIVTTHISLIFKNFKSPVIHIDPMRYASVLNSAYYDVIKGLIATRGDADITQYNWEWSSGRTWLRMHHTINRPMSWSVMALALKGVEHWAWDAASIATEFVILDNFVEVGSGSLGLGFAAAAAAMNGSATG